MAVHDRWARVTPYELSFPALDWARQRFGELSEHARASGVDLGDPARFPLLRAVLEMLDALHGPDPDAGRRHEHALLLYHAFHFWAGGERLFLLETPLVRNLIEDPPAEWAGEPPAPAGYVQLPQHLVWTDPEDGEPPESVDGFFWSAPPGRGELSVLLAAGMREEREGFSVVPLLPAPLADAPEWPRALGRDEGGDFRSRMPGSELEGLYQVRTAGEVLKLVARTLSFLGDHPGREEVPGEGAHPAPTGLPYRKVCLD